MKHVQSIAVAALLCLLLGCQSIGLAPAENLEQRIAYGYSQNAAVRSAAAVALDNRRLEAKEAQSVLSITDQIRTLLDASKLAIGSGDVKTAEGRLALAISLLASLQTRLNEASPRIES